ncbi:MAG: HAMP domain-containing histidine kinase [Oscillospiraceae bacterium]|nr:HAMP domain-containing histidine kinase [Oscillospiraceae bacterium]
MKKFILAIVIFAAISGVFATITFRETATQPNAVIINDTAMAVAAMPYYDVAEVSLFLTDQLTYAFQEMDYQRENRDQRLQLIIYIFIAVFTIGGIALFLYCELTILSPFRKLQGFARSVAEGQLDTPLEMDKHNRFGAFSESFDIMREEIHKANQSKKELVAALSHDIKTPIASIKAVTELMLVKNNDEKQQAQLGTITAKAEQVNALITNMFDATLEELQVLHVTPIEEDSAKIAELIKTADYEGRTAISQIPSCLVIADLLRLQQVFDNIISNSYKYADTDIVVSAAFEEQYLVIKVKDFGAGVSSDELPHLFDKFYRGGNREKVSGQGLGLYISRYFMKQMQGDIVCNNYDDGFAVKVFIKLA